MTSSFFVVIVQAPEVLKREEYSFSSDVYSFGMILVELVTLLPPFKQEQFKNLRKITNYVEVSPLGSLFRLPMAAVPTLLVVTVRRSHRIVLPAADI